MAITDSGRVGSRHVGRSYARICKGTSPSRGPVDYHEQTIHPQLFSRNIYVHNPYVNVEEGARKDDDHTATRPPPPQPAAAGDMFTLEALFARCTQNLATRDDQVVDSKVTATNARATDLERDINKMKDEFATMGLETSRPRSPKTTAGGKSRRRTGSTSIPTKASESIAWCPILAHIRGWTPSWHGEQYTHQPQRGE